ncbi:amidohydrolase [Clostridium botulinum]|uniref:Peptidase n=1 Tax=Clostridium botulinum (strain Hall / ATCC 3502 / NCTC 13319 / Type A) TaxID=441771 RepID=A5I0Z3_CLOBH|nr:M20 family metallopeptidase [Clostridium botulinum]NFL70781.1 amidohydrolase [Clostridium botulinum]NFQ54719.1 amidohydrolase [Clostridium botulinum]NFT48049.1 amidohydrolase [Clostridium botulinum]QGT42998.1 putative hydrolase YxeP [Clostridium botulinum]RUT55057.1 amidohydrolase family protein [Clostridium botulinum]
MNSKIKNIAKEIQASLIEIRRNFHEIPELAFEEYHTSEMILEQLKKMKGMEILTGYAGGTGIVGILQGKKGKSDQCLMIRADIDALPIEENNELSYCSKEKGKMHACGHDAHITWTLGAAMILTQLREEFAGTVKFIFQPAEETGSGARKMVEEHVLENPKVHIALGAHGFPQYDTGKIIIPKKNAFSAARTLFIKVIGKGGHGSWPQDCVDPIAVANHIYMSLQQIISRRIKPGDASVLTVGSIHAGPMDKGNIIPNECVLKGTLRHVTMEGMESMVTWVKEISNHIAKANGAKVIVKCSHGVEPVVNDEACSVIFKHSAEEIVGKNNVAILEEDNLGGEDFYHYSKKVKSVYFFVGCAPKDKVGSFSLHSSDFCIDESILGNVSAILANAAICFLMKNYI